MNQESFKDMLKEKGLKVTNQRVIILKVLSSSPGMHLTTEEIYDLVKDEYPEIGLATVYRTLQLLLDLNLIDKINLNDGFIRYEIAEDKNKISGHHHHHLICTECGNVFSFEDDLLENLEEKISSKTGFEVIDHEVKLYGYCTNCKKEH
jgi:Fur family ferric uptake transcriptional regulator